MYFVCASSLESVARFCGEVILNFCMVASAVCASLGYSGSYSAVLGPWLGFVRIFFLVY